MEQPKFNIEWAPELLAFGKKQIVVGSSGIPQENIVKYWESNHGLIRNLGTPEASIILGNTETLKRAWLTNESDLCNMKKDFSDYALPLFQMNVEDAIPAAFYDYYCKALGRGSRPLIESLKTPKALLAYLSDTFSTSKDQHSETPLKGFKVPTVEMSRKFFNLIELEDLSLRVNPYNTIAQAPVLLSDARISDHPTIKFIKSYE
jgi:hypothetical protein